MHIKKIIFAIAVLMLAHAPVGFAQDEALSEDDLEVIEILEILENLELLEEDLDLLDNMSEIGEDDDS
ncbi:MAG: hypothetical protein R3274_05380 [Desulfobacterales bacterium]|nr:hypothetical protein [Desulfobacterales bacterium]